MKIYIPPVNESWVVDRFREEWIDNNPSLTTDSIEEADIIWIIAPWAWKRISKKYLKKKVVVCTIHHLEENDYLGSGLRDFNKRDNFVNHYHVISKKTFNQISELTSKDITNIPFWVNNNIWFDIENKKKLRKKFGISEKEFTVGSFQRDTEGKDLVSPKLIKGPDRFITIANDLNSKHDNLTVVLTGKRRQYVITKLDKLNIKYMYFEMVDFKMMNQLYNILDLYIVASRVEGGPQAIVECGLSRTPIISTDVGIATEILGNESVFNMDNFQLAKPNIDEAFKNSLKFTIPNGFKSYVELFNSLVIN